MEREPVFNAYQQTHGLRLETALTKTRYVASFIGDAPKVATFVGLYENQGHTEIAPETFAIDPDFSELGRHGVRWPANRDSMLRFRLNRMECLR